MKYRVIDFQDPKLKASKTLFRSLTHSGITKGHKRKKWHENFFERTFRYQNGNNLTVLCLLKSQLYFTRLSESWDSGGTRI